MAHIASTVLKFSGTMSFMPISMSKVSSMSAMRPVRSRESMTSSSMMAV